MILCSFLFLLFDFWASTSSTAFGAQLEGMYNFRCFLIIKQVDSYPWGSLEIIFLCWDMGVIGASQSIDLGQNVPWKVVFALWSLFLPQKRCLCVSFLWQTFEVTSCYMKVSRLNCLISCSSQKENKGSHHWQVRCISVIAPFELHFYSFPLFVKFQNQLSRPASGPTRLSVRTPPCNGFMGKRYFFFQFCSFLSCLKDLVQTLYVPPVMLKVKPGSLNEARYTYVLIWFRLFFSFLFRKIKPKHTFNYTINCYAICRYCSRNSIPKQAGFIPSRIRWRDTRNCFKVSQTYIYLYWAKSLLHTYYRIFGLSDST